MASLDKVKLFKNKVIDGLSAVKRLNYLTKILALQCVLGSRRESYVLCRRNLGYLMKNKISCSPPSSIQSTVNTRERKN